MLNSVIKGYPKGSSKMLASTQRSLYSEALNFNKSPTSTYPNSKLSPLFDKYAPWEESKILLTGCQGQIGVPLAKALCDELGPDQVIASDL